MSEAENPPKKFKRIIQKCDAKKNNNSNCNCDNITKKIDEVKVCFEQEVSSLQVNLQQQVSGLQSQLKIAVEALAEQKVILGRLLTQQTEVDALQLKFPLENESQLLKLNDTINNSNKSTYIRVMSALLSPSGVVKHLKYVLSTEIVLQYNIDGVHGKKSLRQLDKFYNTLLESISNTNLGPAEVQLRKALQLQKKTSF